MIFKFFKEYKLYLEEYENYLEEYHTISLIYKAYIDQRRALKYGTKLDYFFSCPENTKDTKENEQ